MVGARSDSRMHVAAHEPRDLSRDREPEPAARCHAALDAVEALEHGVPLRGRNPRPVVLDDELAPVPPCAGLARRTRVPAGVWVIAL